MPAIEIEQAGGKRFDRRVEIVAMRRISNHADKMASGWGARQPVRRYTLKMTRWLLILLAFAVGERAAAEPLPDTLLSGGIVRVTDALDGMTLRLEDGRMLRLAAVETPAAELPRAATDRGGDRPAQRRAGEGAGAAGRAVAELAAGREAALYYDERRNDRYGRIVAHVVVLPDLWLQQELLRRGLARVHTTADTAAAAAALLRAEAQARAARRGLWAQTAFQIRRPDELGRWMDSFQIVEGRITGVRRTASQTWLEFAVARGRPAEITIASGARRQFRDSGLDPAGLAEKTLRVRGWVRWQNGPIIEVDHPAQIELLD